MPDYWGTAVNPAGAARLPVANDMFNQIKSGVQNQLQSNPSFQQLGWGLPTQLPTTQQPTAVTPPPANQPNLTASNPFANFVGRFIPGMNTIPNRHLLNNNWNVNFNPVAHNPFAGIYG